MLAFWNDYGRILHTTRQKQGETKKDVFSLIEHIDKIGDRIFKDMGEKR